MGDHRNAPPVVGVDVGGTKISAALVYDDGRVAYARQQPTQPDRGPAKVLRTIVEMVQQLRDHAPGSVAGLGLGIAGQINTADGVVIDSPNLGWRDISLKEPLENALGLSVYVTNDVNAATWGEWQYGAGRGHDNLIGVFIGTGVGTGVISGGRLLGASHLSATELGHVPIVFDGRECTCGHRGCLEAYVGGWAIAKRAQDIVRQDSAAGQALLAVAGDVEDISAGVVADAFRKGDEVACELVSETSQCLAAAAVGMVNTFNPSLMIFGGGVMAGLPEIMADVEKVVRRHAFSAFVQEFSVTRAFLGSDAGVIGAASLARMQQHGS